MLDKVDEYPYFHKHLVTPAGWIVRVQLRAVANVIELVNIAVRWLQVLQVLFEVRKKEANGFVT